MAEAPRNRLPSGHDEEFVSEVDDDFHCLICQLPLKQPVLTRCGHRYCKECLEEHLRRQEAQAQRYSCPADREALDRDRGVFPDKATERAILSLAIKCPSEGCEWTGELRNKEAHLATCPFEEVPCTNENCHVSLRRTDLEQHVTIMCEWRIIECEYCKERHPECHMKNHLVSCVFVLVPCTNQNCGVMVARKDLTEHVTVTCQWRITTCKHCEGRHPQCLMKSHLERCDKYPISCPNNCGATISREEATMHIKNDCPQTLVRCSLDWIGCNSKIRRGELESHLSCETRHHLDLACSKLNDTREQAEINTRKLERLEKCKKENKDEILNLQNQRNQLQESVNTLERQLEERVNNLHPLINNNEIKIDRKVFWITTVFFVAVVGVLFKIHIDSVHKNLKEELNGVRGQLEKRGDSVHKNLKEELNGVRSQLEKRGDSVHKNLKEELNGVRSQLEKRGDSGHKNLKEELNGVRSLLEKRVDSVHKNLKEELNGVRSQLEKRGDSGHKNVKEELNGVRSQLEKRAIFVQKTPANEVNTCTWKITDFESVLEKAKTGQNVLALESFGSHGYTLRLEIYPNGINSGEGTHLSLCVVVIKDEDDTLLPWPFTGKVEVRLVDQQEDPKERKNIVSSFTGLKEEKEYLKRPVLDYNPLEFRFATFVSHKTLKTRRYIVDDTVFIQTEVLYVRM